MISAMVEVSAKGLGNRGGSGLIWTQLPTFIDLVLLKIVHRHHNVWNFKKFVLMKSQPQKFPFK